jgi:hypothetical protein
MNICSFPCRNGCGLTLTPRGPAGQAENDEIQTSHDQWCTAVHSPAPGPDRGGGPDLQHPPAPTVIPARCVACVPGRPYIPGCARCPNQPSR